MLSDLEKGLAVHQTSNVDNNSVNGMSIRSILIFDARVPARDSARCMLAKELEIALFEAGMFAWMAITYYWLFPSPHLKPNMAVFWYMMQIAMIAGFFTSLPANAWLIHKGWKEKMPELALEQASMRQERIGLRYRPISTQSSRVPRWMMCACILADGIHTLWKMRASPRS